MPGADTIANRANLRGVWVDQTTVLSGRYATPTFTISGQTLGNGCFSTLTLENRNPEIRADSIAVNSSGPTTVDVASLLSNDSDPDGDRLRVIGIGALPSKMSTLGLHRHSAGGVRDAAEGSSQSLG